MKILELCHFSAGGCGVFARVKQESQLLAQRGHEVRIFSSNREKGTNKIISENDVIGKVKVKRFPAFKFGGESFMSWHFEKDAEEFKPDVIIAHGYRHPHTTKALFLAEKIKCKVFLVTHAPFAREDNRNFLNNTAVFFYDLFIGRRTINKFDKIFAITYWEYLYLNKLETKKDKIEYIPNGIAIDYFAPVKAKKIKKIIYTGRIAPIKNIEVVIKSLNKIKDKGVKFYIFGPAEESYLKKIKKLISEEKVGNRINIKLINYNKKEHIRELDKSSIFILPSFSEGMPQSLVEAMARECIVIGSDNLGNADIIKSEDNGFLFKNDDEKDLARIIDGVIDMNLKNILMVRKNAKEKAERFKWKEIIDKIESFF